MPFGFPLSNIRQVYGVTDVQTDLRLRWQDGSETVESSLGLMPYRNVDE